MVAPLWWRVAATQTHLDNALVTGQRDIAQLLILQQRRQHCRQVGLMVVPAETVLLVHCSCVSAVPAKRKAGGKKKTIQISGPNW